MDLKHFTEKPLVLNLDRGVLYQQQIDHKPKGLWVSVGDEWAEWCRGENFNTENLACTNLIELDNHANILTLSNVDSIFEFHDKYSVVAYRSIYHIDWRLVSADFDGIIISPYQWTLRTDRSVFWYYGWDVASGCIWNLSAIKNVRSVINASSELV